MAIRKTRQRAAIREALERAHRPMSPQELLEAARNDAPSLSIATVYRALRDLEDSGFLRSVSIPHQSPLYERAGTGHHHHFCCQHCDRVFDIHACPAGLEDLAPAGFVVESHDIVLYGCCATCRLDETAEDSAEPSPS